MIKWSKTLNVEEFRDLPKVGVGRKSHSLQMIFWVQIHVRFLDFNIKIEKIGKNCTKAIKSFLNSPG